MPPHLEYAWVIQVEEYWTSGDPPHLEGVITTLPGALSYLREIWAASVATVQWDEPEHLSETTCVVDAHLDRGTDDERSLRFTMRRFVLMRGTIAPRAD